MARSGKCRCGSDYFSGSPVVQVAGDGRAMILATDARFPFIWHLQCLACGDSYILPDRNRSKGLLVPLNDFGNPLQLSREAKALIDEDRQDFDKSFDPRQVEMGVKEEKADAPLA